MVNEYGYTPRQYRPHHLDRDDPGCVCPKEALFAKQRMEASDKFLTRLKEVYGPREIEKLIEPENVPTISVVINRKNKRHFKSDAEAVYEIYKLFDLTNPNN